MFDIIIPTIWAPSIESIDLLIESLNSCKYISKIILINNNPKKFSKRYSVLDKVEEHHFDNIYVNQAWNYGVDISSSEYISIINDDIIFDTKIFEYLIEKLNEDDVKIVGLCKSTYSLEKNEDFFIEKITLRNRGWGCFISLKRTNYFHIPPDLLIHFGDDFLIKKLEGYVWKLKGLKITSQISTSVDFDSKFLEIIKQDNINSLKYHLPWSNDY